MEAPSSPEPTSKLQFENSVIDLRLDLPPLPRTVTEVSHLIASPSDQIDAAALAEVVDGDPVVAAAVLRRVNSAYYGMRRRVGSVRRAVMYLGFEEVANIVLTAGLSRFGETFATDGHRAFFNRIMEISVGAGQYARVLARLFDLPVEGEAYSAGLLHALGRLLFLYNRPDEYTTLGMEDPQRVLPTVEAERELFGTSHPQVGAQAAEAWELPPLVVQVIRHYLNSDALDDPKPRMRAALVGASVAAASMNTSQREGVVGADMPEALQWSGPLRVLARVAGTDAKRIADAIEDEEEAVAHYVSAMMAT